ncbi:MAG TPA: Holliday junction branch migration protein RuvA [Magnetospirillaceae bacterium]|jgi:Holliday junction DNA helicase RuvA
MIARLKGLVDSAGADSAVIDVGGVGYLIFGSSRTLGHLAVGQAIALFVETHVREDHIHLYGFIDAAERDWFRLLLTVQGVGGKVALAILSALSTDELARAIAAGDKTALSRANGVGAKLAARLAIELKDKAVGIAIGPATTSAAPVGVVGSAGEAVSALVNLGYRRAEAEDAILKAVANAGEGADAKALVRYGLRQLGRVS